MNFIDQDISDDNFYRLSEVEIRTFLNGDSDRVHEFLEIYKEYKMSSGIDDLPEMEIEPNIPNQSEIMDVDETSNSIIINNDDDDDETDEEEDYADYIADESDFCQIEPACLTNRQTLSVNWPRNAILNPL